MEINHENYFVASAAEFRPIPKKWVIRLLEGGDSPVRLGNQTFRRAYTSVGRYGSFSSYWEDAEGTTLVRVSDHWCGNPEADFRKTNLCGKIRSCLWWLRGSMHPVSTREGLLTGGIVRFRDMRQLEP